MYDDIYLQRQILKWINYKIYTFNSQIFKSFKLGDIKCINGRIANRLQKAIKDKFKVEWTAKRIKIIIDFTFAEKTRESLDRAYISNL